jgi:HAE1 family hydrophobic/amphiphilic exporter-1
MARAIAGGLTFSTIVTLLALPCIYSLLDDARMWSRRVIRDGREGRVLRRPEQLATLTAAVLPPTK